MRRRSHDTLRIESNDDNLSAFKYFQTNKCNVCMKFQFKKLNVNVNKACRR